MKHNASYNVVLQVQSEDGKFSQLSVSVTAGDVDNARTSAVEKAQKDGHKVTNCHKVELVG